MNEKLKDSFFLEEKTSMLNPNFDLSQEFKKSLISMNFSPKSLDKILNHPKYLESITADSQIKKKMLITLCLYDIIADIENKMDAENLRTEKNLDTTPAKIARSAITYSLDLLDWLNDIKIYTLPFIRDFEDLI